MVQHKKTIKRSKKMFGIRYKGVYRSEPTPADYRIAGYKTPKRKWRKF